MENTPSSMQNVVTHKSEEKTESSMQTATSPINALEIESRVIEVLQTCYDPEIPVNIYELGLIYDIDVSPQGEVYIRMTLTSPACPVAGSLPPEVEEKVRAIPGVTNAQVDVVWD
ncbi:MAG TPA: iron-sulfur cluster assembly protein, partial [Chthonomonadales bacterium]|nr:iron-sulfur cluster assembly protein [Chthonomonadales bacterium]